MANANKQKFRTIFIYQIYSTDEFCCAPIHEVADARVEIFQTIPIAAALNQQFKRAKAGTGFCQRMLGDAWR